MASGRDELQFDALERREGVEEAYFQKAGADAVCATEFEHTVEVGMISGNGSDSASCSGSGSGSSSGSGSHAISGLAQRQRRRDQINLRQRAAGRRVNAEQRLRSEAFAEDLPLAAWAVPAPSVGRAGALAPALSLLFASLPLLSSR